MDLMRWSVFSLLGVPSACHIGKSLSAGYLNWASLGVLWLESTGMSLNSGACTSSGEFLFSFGAVQNQVYLGTSRKKISITYRLGICHTIRLENLCILD